VTLFGVPVRFHFTFVLLLIFLVVVGLEGRQSAVADVLFVGALFASVLLHELGHAVVARRYGVRTLEIVLFPIGGVARLEKMPRAREELWIAVAGPAVNFLIAAVILAALAIWRGVRVEGVATLAEPTDSNLLERIALGNLVLALFNLLPAFPMDGGRILRSILALRRTEEEATQIASRAGRVLAILMGLYGLLSMHFMLVFVAFFVYLGATQEGEAAVGRSLTQGLPVRAAMVTRYLTLSHGQTIGDAAQLMLESTQQDFPVLHGDRVVGLLDRHRLLRAMAQEGPAAYVAGAMNRDFTRVNPDTDLAEALASLAEAGPCALVMEGEHLLGLLTRENVTEFLLLRRVGMRPATP
jgi:Zn-dependent protease/CBS domain-containing protein